MGKPRRERLRSCLRRGPFSGSLCAVRALTARVPALGDRWNVPLVVHEHGADDRKAPSDRTHRKLALEAALRQRLEVILTTASGKKDHIPPTDGLAGEVPWFEISSNTSEAWSGLDLFKQLLSSPPKVI